MDQQNPYQIVAEALASGASPGWSKILLDAEIGDGYVDTGYKSEAGSTVRSFAVASDSQTRIEDALMALQQEMMKPGHAPWSRCTFTLFPDGKFRFDVEYDDENAD